MSKKAWTPDNCPLQVGSVLHHTTTNTDYMVLARSLDYTDDYATDTDRALVAVQYFNTPESHWLTGKDLSSVTWEYYPNWPDASVTKPCYHEIEDKEDSMTDIEFAQLVFDAAKKLPGISKLYETNEHGTSVWDDDAHAVVQENVVAILEGLQKCVEEKNG